ncbi:hypothetical protein [Microcoleus sp. BROC3]|uniref:hypothetical protein n=1 Tax=Microcoleus sp. BROC3 TaxID=3055323 RepID=UPI002FCF6484
MSNIEIAGIQSNLIEELDDADLMAVVGGSLLSNVGGIATGPGNDSQPTSSTVVFLGNTVAGLGTLISDNVAGFAEGALQGVNATVTGITG